jgi:Excalibur calcium-binding domain
MTVVRSQTGTDAAGSGTFRPCVHRNVVLRWRSVVIQVGGPFMLISARRTGIALAAASTLTATALVVAPAASAQTVYANCTALHRDFQHGVAKSYTAAFHEQQLTGYPMAAYGRHARHVYWANASSMDRDHDGVDCEA